MKFACIALIAAFALTGCAQQSPLQAAVDGCDVRKGYARIGDDGRSLSLDNEGEDDISGLSFSDITCVLDALDVPDSVLDKMGNTRALDGMQTASWGDITATWTYHPDDGLDVILEMAS